jgi:hypothetical protein
VDELRLFRPEAFALIDRAAVKLLVCAHARSPVRDRPRLIRALSQLRETWSVPVFDFGLIR